MNPVLARAAPLAPLLPARAALGVPDALGAR
jgi:hypothetical protein